MRSLAAFVARTDADIFGVSEIDSGDALAIATRFALQWGYRGGQALFWKPALVALSVLDTYLPFSPSRPFERRGLVRVELLAASKPLAIFVTKIGAERDQRIRDLRYLRASLRAGSAPAVVFSLFSPRRIDLFDLGFVRAGCRGVDDENIYIRGVDLLEAYDAGGARDRPGIGSPLVARFAVTARD